MPELSSEIVTITPASDKKSYIVEQTFSNYTTALRSVAESWGILEYGLPTYVGSCGCQQCSQPRPSKRKLHCLGCVYK